MNISLWFTGATHHEFGKSQTVAHTLLHIALTMRIPHHPNAYMRCCHKYAAAVMAHAETNPDREQRLDDSDEILILGFGNTVSHTIVRRPSSNAVIVDSLENKGFKGEYNPEKEEYFAVLIEGGTRKETTPLKIMKRICFGEFKKHYLDNIIVNNKYDAPIAA